MTLFKRVFNTPPQSQPIAPVEIEDPQLDQALDASSLLDPSDEDTPALADPQPKAEADGVGDVKGHQGIDITPIPKNEDYTLTSADDLGSSVERPHEDDTDAELAKQEALAAQEIAAFQAKLAEKQRVLEETRRSQSLRRSQQLAKAAVDTSAPPASGAAHDSPPEKAHVAAPASSPEAEPAPRSARRVRTRMLGFDQGITPVKDPIEKAASQSDTHGSQFPVGWIVVTDGPGRGHTFTLHSGVSTIGRGDDQTIVLDLGDTSISREKHAAIAFDEESNSFFLGHGGKSNIVRLNGRPVLSTEDLRHGDTIRIGETTLKFAALCGDDFAWGGAGHVTGE